MAVESLPNDMLAICFMYTTPNHSVFVDNRAVLLCYLYFTLLSPCFVAALGNLVADPGLPGIRTVSFRFVFHWFSFRLEPAGADAFVSFDVSVYDG